MSRPKKYSITALSKCARYAEQGQDISLDVAQEEVAAEYAEVFLCVDVHASLDFLR